MTTGRARRRAAVLPAVVLVACAGRQAVVVDHGPGRGARRQNVEEPTARHTACEPPVDVLEADFARFVAAPSLAERDPRP